MKPQRDLGAALGSVLEPGPSRATLAAQRPRVLAAMQAAAGAPRRRASAWLAAAAVAALCIAGVSAWDAERPKDLTASHDGSPVVARGVVRGARAEGELLHFSDGTRFRVTEGAELKVSELGAGRVALALSQGLVHADVTKTAQREWSISAGPYRVEVVGTEFSVEWSPEAREIDVRVAEGRVLVFGFELPESGLALASGARFHRALRVLSAPPPSAPPPHLGDDAAERSPALTSSSRRSPTPALSARASSSPPLTSWRDLANEQRYPEALAAARAEGMDRLLPALNDAELLLLANTARYAGEVAEARRILLLLRARFPRSPNATVAALVLAGIEERAKNSSEVARWLRTFLAESPDGELSAGARARLLGILVRSGQRAESRRVAADYLRYHPRGPYAADARGVLDSGTTP